MELTYDANGNLKSYGEKQYTWNYGKSLGTITDGENTYSYTYNENGIIASKNINGVKTEINTINGKVLSQKTGEDILYFQYDSSDVPVGFVYNDAAYYYITNISNDVVGITDSAGNIIAEYEYDEWGKLISVEAESEEAQTIAQMNPLRYRGYYYDNETGYYYLQSRYYDPGLGRFISADDFRYVDAEGRATINAYAYCINNPLIYIDIYGQYPKSSEVPPASSGYKAPKGGPVKGKVPKGSYKGQIGWKDSSGRYWIPDKSNHGGDHWDVVSKNGKSHVNVYRDGHIRGDDDDDFKGGGGSSASEIIDSIVEFFVPTDDVVTVVVSIIPIIIVLAFLVTIGLPIILPILVMA